MPLSEYSKKLRREIIKLSKANGGYHYGGTFSCVEILIALYDHVLTDIDRFVLSKGHACWGYYVLLQKRGFKPSLEGHPHLDLANDVHWTTGSEGHGFPAGVGMALARKLLRQEFSRVFVLIGDGECQEGTTWESMLLAVQHKLNNLVVIVDNNRIQGSGFTKDILSVECLNDVADDIGWWVDEVDGHNIDLLTTCLSQRSDLPHLVIANTVKCKGISFAENKPEWHAHWPTAEEEKLMLEELK